MTAPAPALRTLAPGKTNLGLFVGPTRPDGLHELVSLIEPLSLADELTLRPLPGADRPGRPGDDVVECPGVDGPNLAQKALDRYRAASGWSGPPQLLTIVKRVPVAAGMGGGSGDAAAALRLIAHAAGRPDDPLLATLAPELGSDVPSQLAPGPVLVRGAGEHVVPVAAPPPHGVLVLPSPHALATPDVFRTADRLGAQRSAAELAARRAAYEAALGASGAARRDAEPRGAGHARPADGAVLPDELLVNDLEPAARALCPWIDGALAAARDAGADHAFVSGAGPTVIGVFWGADGVARAEAAAARVRGRLPGARAARPVAGDVAAVVAVRDNGRRP